MITDSIEPPRKFDIGQFGDELRRIIVVAAHPDDLETACGGTIALLIERGIEVALGLPKPKTEFERDILKAILAKEAGHAVERLVFISKPGARQKCSQPGRVAISEWLLRNHGIATEVHELHEVESPPHDDA